MRSLPVVPRLSTLIVLTCLAAARSSTGATSVAQAPTPPPPTFDYPAPVKGHYEEANTGTFELVDGPAYTATGGKGTVVYASSKALASPVLNATTCPMTEARAIALIRDASFLEVTLDARGHSNYFGAGTVYNGQGRESDTPKNPYWTISGGQVAKGRIAGRVSYKGRGEFDFDLPVFKPGISELSEGDKVEGNRLDSTRRAPTEKELLTAYAAMRRAALAKDLKAMLELQGFDAKQVQAIRGLPGIDANLEAHADRFLDPGDPEEPTVQAGYAGIGGRGKNSKGAAFFNFYLFIPCDNRLLLTSIGLNEQ
jgi:hypothetical protein